MAKSRAISAVVLTFAWAGWAAAQDPPPVPALRTAAVKSTATETAAPVRTVPLIVPKGAPLEIALDEEVRVKKAGQTIHGKVLEPVYAFDRVVIPAGTEVTGRIKELENISGGRRTLSALDANFTPAHKPVLKFEELTLPDGRHMPLHTKVSPGLGQTMEFVSAKAGDNSGVKGRAGAEIEKAKEQAKQAWDQAKKQVSEPGRMHRLERYLEAQLPVHRNFLNAGAEFSAELVEPLDFGTAPLTEQMEATIGRRVTEGDVVHARLITPLTSATAQPGQPVEALLTRPLFEGDNLLYPTGSALKGRVLQAHPSRKMHHNGQLRVVFHDLEAPNGVGERVNAVPIGVAAAQSEHVKLDAEGGAEATSGNARYFSTALTVGLAAGSEGAFGDTLVGDRAAGGAGGFRVVGIVLGVAAHSQPVGMAMGAAGAGRSIYRNFLSQGHELVFPMNTAMDVSVGENPTRAPVCTTVGNTAADARSGNGVACALLHVRMR